MISTNSIYRRLSGSCELEKLNLYQGIARGSTLKVYKFDSQYNNIKSKILKSTTFTIGNLIKQLSNQTASRFVSDHSDYASILTDMKHLKFVIKQESKLKILFDVVVNTTVVYSVISTLYDISFGMMDPALSVHEIIAWVIFIIDFFLNFITEISNDKRYPIRNIKIISIRYLKTWLFPDLLALIPLKIFGYPEIEYFFRLSRIFKVHRIFFMFSVKNLTRYFKENSFAITAKKLKILLAVNIFADLGFEVCKYLFFTYFFACVWYFMCSLLKESSFTGRNFIDYKELDKHPKDEQLIICIYFIFTTLSTVGYGEYSATNSYEMGLAIIIMFIGSAWLALTMSRVISFVRDFEEIGKPKDNLSELTVFLNNLEYIHGKMPSELKSKVYKHFAYFWKNNRLGSLMNPEVSDFSDKLLEIEDKTLRKLPEDVRMEIFEYLFQDYFSMFFKFFGKHDDSFRYDICLYLQPRYYENELILFMEEKARELLFVKSGNVSVGFLKIDNEFIKCFSLSSGVIIGESGVFLDESCIADLKGNNTHGMALSKDAVLGILSKKYPERLKKYQVVVKKRTIALKNTLRNSRNFAFRYSRDRMQARLSRVFNTFLERGQILTLQDVYYNIKQFKNKFKNLSKEINELSASFEKSKA